MLIVIGHSDIQQTQKYAKLWLNLIGKLDRNLLIFLLKMMKAGLKAGLQGEGGKEFFLFVERNADVVQW